MADNGPEATRLKDLAALAPEVIDDRSVVPTFVNALCTLSERVKDVLIAGELRRIGEDGFLLVVAGSGGGGGEPSRVCGYSGDNS